MADYSGYQRQAIRAFGSDAMFEPVLARPLRHAARQVDFSSADFPAFI